MKKKYFTKLILKISDGLVARVVDIFLIGVFYFIEMRPYGLDGSLRQKLSKIERDLELINYSTLKRSFLIAKEKGWINQNLKITKKGEERLQALLPEYKSVKKWDGNWYIVTYDIPENKRRFREILRTALKKLGFGQLQKSVWISPYNFLGNIEKITKEYNLLAFVLLAISDKVGKEPSKVFTNRIWNLEKINSNYKKFIERVKSKKLSKREIIFYYLSVLQRDCQLPKELLPEDWKGEEAYKIYHRAILKSKN